jgi:hypothetical protein
VYSKSLLRSAFEAAVVIFAVAWLLNRAWELVKPLVPVIGVVVAVVVIRTLIMRRLRGW